jgi:arylsulfatase
MIDIAPTILEATHIRAPDLVDGIKQSAIEGVSLMYTFDAKNAEVPSRHKTQYFEMMGDRALYNDGWIASTKVTRYPWENFAPPIDLMTVPWELYDIRNDWTQAEDVAAKNPQKLKELQKLFQREAKKYQVFPLDNSFVARAITPKPSITAGRDEFAWTEPMTGIPNGDAPSILNASYTFKADVEVPAGGGDGMLITQGGRFGGYGFYLLKGKPVFLWNLVDLERVRWEGPAVSPGHHELEFDFKYDGLGMGTLEFGSISGIGRGGTGELKVDGEVVATRQMARSIPFTLQFDESMDIGSDTLTGVNDDDYQPPFAFNGKINKVTLKIDRPRLSPADIEKLKASATEKKSSE